jgi:hypothetical protein
VSVRLEADQRDTRGRLIIGEVLAETRLPRVPSRSCRAREGGTLAEDERIRLLSFTGSPAVGGLEGAGRRKWCSSSAATRPSSSTRASIWATRSERIVFGAFYQSGQAA